MLPSSVTLTATGVSKWIPLNRWQTPFNVGIGCALSSGASITYTVQHTFSDLQNGQNCSITRSGTTATLVLLNGAIHGLTTNDSITVYGTGISNFHGTFTPASIVDASTLTFTVANSGVTSAIGFAIPISVFNNITLASMTTNGDTNYAFGVSGIRLNATVTSGSITMTYIQGKA